MPIVRYFLFASCFSLALLFALDRSLPPLAELSAGPEVERTNIRIRSARPWPEKIIFDTSTQIATTASSPLLAAEPPAHAAGNALAMVEPRTPATNTNPTARNSGAQAAAFDADPAGRATSPHLLSIVR
ncbi:hypothetical protein WI560_02690 [Bradyrhizobium sp. A11]|jgi:hypothetical protein|uniref:hypothetical protein n=1 Tax=Bradyrhizobium sp. A11 TaxID=3133974 RepID=UPI0032553379